MINNFADLLDRIKEKELKAIKKYEIVKHGPMIGDMYEGLTTDMLKISLFEDIDLRVVSGMIKNDKGQLSEQIDCMIVEGEGEQLPHSDDFLYHESKVIAVIQVKKNLYTSDLISSYQNLRSVIDVTEPKEFNNAILRDSYRGMFLNELPNRDKISTLPLLNQYMYHSLIVDSFLPIRIVFGYYGYKTEYNLRKAFIEHLQSNISDDLSHPKMGFGPTSFPNLILCQNLSLIKTNGMPYRGGERNESVNIYASYSEKPMRVLLELIWTRLSYKYGISADIFGEDLETEILRPLLKCSPVSVDNKIGWKYSFVQLTNKELNSGPKTFRWSPAVLDEVQHYVINRLCNHGKISVQDEDLLSILNEDGMPIDLFLDKLCETELVYVEDEFIELLTDECKIAFLPDGRIIAGEDKTGRFSRWIKNYTIERKNGKKNQGL